MHELSTPPATTFTPGCSPSASAASGVIWPMTSVEGTTSGKMRSGSREASMSFGA